jgi:hypothetical protein
VAATIQDALILLTCGLVKASVPQSYRGCQLVCLTKLQIYKDGKKFCPLAMRLWEHPSKCIALKDITLFCKLIGNYSTWHC